jgi:RNA polymerase sigma-70 factor (ECF subfamily)
VSEEESRAKQVEVLSRAHGDYLHALARKLCRGQFDAEDLVQEVLVKVLRAPLPAGVNERAWLGRVMHNQLIDWVRRRATRRESELVESAAAVDPGWWQRLTFERVDAMIARLPDDQRTVFEMFVLDGKSYDEIAARLGIAKATVGTRILRARQKLRDLLGEERGDG